MVYFHLIIVDSIWLYYCQLLLFCIKFFVHGYMRSSQIQILTGYQLKRSQTKQIVKSHILCNYVSKENSKEAFSKSRCCSVITLLALTRRTS